MYVKEEYQLKIIRIIANRRMWINPLTIQKHIQLKYVPSFCIEKYHIFGPYLLETVLNR